MLTMHQKLITGEDGRALLFISFRDAEEENSEASESTGCGGAPDLNVVEPNAPVSQQQDAAGRIFTNRE